MGFTNLSLTNKVTKLTIVNRLSVRNSNLKNLTTFSNSKKVCNKIAFVFVLVGLISISSMVSSAAVGADPTTTVATTLVTTTLKTTTLKTTTDDKETTQKPDPTDTATTQKADPTDTATTQKADPTNTGTTQTGATGDSGAGCPKITYGMLFSVISAILFLSV